MEFSWSAACTLIPISPHFLSKIQPFFFIYIIKKAFLIFLFFTKKKKSKYVKYKYHSNYNDTWHLLSRCGNNSNHNGTWKTASLNNKRLLFPRQLDQDGLHELNVQAFWQRKGGTYWVRYIHVELLGFQPRSLVGVTTWLNLSYNSNNTQIIASVFRGFSTKCFSFSLKVVIL